MGASLPGGRGGTMRGPRQPRNRLTSLVAAFAPGAGVRGGAGAAAVGVRAALGVPGLADRPHLRVSDHAGAPPARRGASCSHERHRGPRRARRDPRRREPPPAARPARGAGTKPEERPGRAPRARDRVGTRGCSPPLRRLRGARPQSRGARGERGPAPSGRRGPTRAPAHLVLDLGRKPVGRALVEVAHGGRRRKEAASGRGVLALGFPAPGPEERPQRQTLGDRSWARRRRAGGASKAGSDCVPPSLPSARRRALTAPTSARGLWGLAGQPDQWRAACSRLARQGRCAPSPRGRGPRPALTPPRQGGPSSRPGRPARGRGAPGGRPAA